MVKHAKSLQTGCADQTIWSTILFSMSFAVVYYSTISIFQHIRAECETVLHANKAEIRTEGGPTKTLCVCVFYYYYYFRLYFVCIVCFSFNVLFCLSRTPNAIDSMLFKSRAKTRSQNIRKRDNIWMINPLFDFGKKILRTSQNRCAYYMWNHRCGVFILIQTKK